MIIQNHPKQMSIFDLKGSEEHLQHVFSKNTLNKQVRTDIIGARTGIIDLWKAFMVDGAKFAPGTDIPICPTTASVPPKNLISWKRAKQLHRQEIRKRHRNYKMDAYIHFFIDDQYFDGLFTSIWFYPKRALKIIKHFAGIIAPDFSTYIDFPDPLKRWNIYRMNAFGYWIGSLGVSVIANARWGRPETWTYCWDGIRFGDMIAIGTVGSGLRQKINYDLFEQGFEELIYRVHPSTIVVYGSANYPCFDRARNAGITIVAFSSETSERFARGRRHE